MNPSGCSQGKKSCEEFNCCCRIDCSSQRQRGYIRRNSTSQACMNQLDYNKIPPSFIFTSLTNYFLKTYPQLMIGSTPPIFIPFPIPIYIPPIPIPTPVIWEDYSDITGNIHDYAHYTTDKPNTQSIMVDGTSIILKATGRYDVSVIMTNLFPLWFITAMSPVPLPDFVNYQVMIVEINDAGFNIIPPFVTGLNITTEQSAVTIKTNFLLDVDDKLKLRVWLITFLPNLWITKVNINKVSELGGSTLQYTQIYRPRH